VIDVVAEAMLAARLPNGPNAMADGGDVLSIRCERGRGEIASHVGDMEKCTFRDWTAPSLATVNERAFLMISPYPFVGLGFLVSNDIAGIQSTRNPS
jgi:hypothetical protein